MAALDERARAAVDAVRAEAVDLADPEIGLARVRAAAAQRGPAVAAWQRWTTHVAAAAVVVAAVAVAVTLVSRDGGTGRIGPADPAPVTAVDVPAPSTNPTEPIAGSTPPSPPTAPPTTGTPGPTRGSGSSVSYRDPPPMLEPQPFASLPEPLGAGVGRYSIAAAETGVVVVDRIDQEAIVIGSDGATRTVPLAAALFDPTAYGSFTAQVAGPHDVLYGLVWRPIPDGACCPITAIVAVALTGEHAGQVVAEAEVGAAAYTHPVPGLLGRGPRGVIDRSSPVRTPLIGYVDATGRPLGPIEAPDVVADDLAATGHTLTVRRADGVVTWSLSIERHPDYTAPFGRVPRPVATSDGGAVWWTTIGPPVEPTMDFSSTIEVIAVLDATGGVQWWQLPEGWHVAAADADGTVLARLTDDGVELARLNPAPD